jgi:N-acetylglucosaminyltransferase
MARVLVDQLVIIALRVVFVVYMVLVLMHSSLEHWYSLRSSRNRRERPAATPRGSWPAVDVVIPCFNEDPDLLNACCRSVAAQDHRD